MFIRRTKIWAWALVVVLLAAIGVGSSGSADLQVTRHDLRTSPQAAAFRVVQLSDLHLQRFGSTEQAIAAQVQALQPDLVVLSGDIIDRVEALPLLQPFLEALGGVPVVAVPGNWEYWSGLDFRAMDAMLASRPGGRFLINERHTLEAKGRTVHVVGLDDFTAGQPDVQMLTAPSSGNPVILVQHSPGFFDSPEVARRMQSQRFTLCLSGHTHGGQVAWAGWAPFRPVGSGRFVAGFYDVPGCRLYVSRGVGTSVVPVRWGAPPELAVFDL